MARPLINVPAKVKRGEVFEIKTLISHTMETGFRLHNHRRAESRVISLPSFYAATMAKRFFEPISILRFPPTRSSLSLR